MDVVANRVISGILKLVSASATGHMGILKMGIYAPNALVSIMPLFLITLRVVVALRVIYGTVLLIYANVPVLVTSFYQQCSNV